MASTPVSVPVLRTDVKTGEPGSTTGGVLSPAAAQAAASLSLEKMTQANWVHFLMRKYQNEQKETPDVLSPASASPSPSVPMPLKVGIIGAGMAGLYSALILQSLGIDFEIFESNPHRIGGRVWTYRFNGDAGKKAKRGTPEYYDYFDLGAMRFPMLAIMDRVIGTQDWSLWNQLNKANKGHKRYEQLRIDLKPYVLYHPQELLRFNGQQIFGKDDLIGDPLHFSIKNRGAVPDAYALNSTYDTCLAVAFNDFVNKKLSTGRFEDDAKNLLDYDNYSVRSYLGLFPNAPPDPTKGSNSTNSPALPSSPSPQSPAASPCPPPPPPFPVPYPPAVVDWCETRDSGSLLYDESLTETVLEYINFSTGSSSSAPDPTKINQDWKLIDGGTDRLVLGLEAALKLGRKAKNRKKLHMGRKVTRIEPAEGSNGGITITTTHVQPPSSALEASFNGLIDTKTEQLPSEHKNDKKAGLPDAKKDTFKHVITTMPLSLLRAVNTDKCNFSYLKRTGLRMLRYDYAVKVGLKFKTRFWEDAKKMGGEEKVIIGGQSFSDAALRRVVYPSYGLGPNLKPDPKNPGVLMASYAWSQDAARVAAPTPDETVELVLQGLEQLHGKLVRDEYDHKYAIIDWYQNRYSQGAYAWFGPSQFSTFYAALIAPEVGGQLHFAGEATDMHHAWIVGALNSAYRSVWEILTREGLHDKKKELIDEWGVVENVDYNKTDPVEAVAAARAAAAAPQLLISDKTRYLPISLVAGTVKPASVTATVATAPTAPTAIRFAQFRG